MKPFASQRGFTLIEVLIAAFILFMAIAAISMIYKGALQSSDKAERSVYINGLLPLMMDQVQHQLRATGAGQNSMTGKGAMGAATFEWQASLLQLKAAAPKVIAEAGTIENQTPRFRLWQVQIDAYYKGYQRQYQYVELSWDPL